jgi:hypothetical protein
MPDYTGGDLNLRGLGWGAAIIVGSIGCALLAAALLLRARGPAANTPPHPFQAPAPLLQPAPQPDRGAYFADKRRLLDSYGWVDRQAGVARIPLDEAMKLLAARGVAAARPAPPSAAPGRTPPVMAPREGR